MYRSFENYANKKDDFERLTLEDFAKTAVSHDSNSVNNLIERIHAFIATQNSGFSDSGLLKLLQESYEVSSGRKLLINYADVSFTDFFYIVAYSKCFQKI